VCSCMQFDLLAANCHSWLCACSMGEGERERVASSRGVGLRARVMDAIETSNAKAAALRRLHARRSIDRPTGKAAAAETASLARKRHGRRVTCCMAVCTKSRLRIVYFGIFSHVTNHVYFQTKNASPMETYL
jgi:hypothetical protein